MAIKAPLVMGSDGLPQQLQPADSLASAGATYISRTVTNSEGASAIVIGAPVYAFAADAVKKAQANAKATSKLAGLGLSTTTAAGALGDIISEGVLVATAVQWDAVAGTTGGLAFGTIYFLDPVTSGKLTATPPSTVGQCVVVIGVALSTTELDLQISLPILL